MNSRQVPRIEWFKVLVELQNHNLPVESVAKHIEVAKSTVLGWKQGAEPRHGDGELLLALWEHVTGRSRTTAPRITPLELRNTKATDELTYIASRKITPVVVIKPDMIRRPTLTAEGWILPSVEPRARV